MIAVVEGDIIECARLRLSGNKIMAHTSEYPECHFEIWSCQSASQAATVFKEIAEHICEGYAVVDFRIYEGAKDDC